VYLSDSARELIKIVRGFTWGGKNRAGADRFVRSRRQRA
jgi:hypothetical protein